MEQSGKPNIGQRSDGGQGCFRRKFCPAYSKDPSSKLANHHGNCMPPWYRENRRERSIMPLSRLANPACCRQTQHTSSSASVPKTTCLQHIQFATADMTACEKACGFPVFHLQLTALVLYRAPSEGPNARCLHRERHWRGRQRIRDGAKTKSNEASGSHTLVLINEDVARVLKCK